MSIVHRVPRAPPPEGPVLLLVAKNDIGGGIGAHPRPLTRRGGKEAVKGADDRWGGVRISGCGRVMSPSLGVRQVGASGAGGQRLPGKVKALRL
jgi:hypothetical protein